MSKVSSLRTCPVPASEWAGVGLVAKHRLYFLCWKLFYHMRPSYSFRSFCPCELAGCVTLQAFLKKETDWKRLVVLPFQFCHNLIFPGPLQLYLKWMDNPSLLQRWLGENFNSQTHPVFKPRRPLSFLAPESVRLNPVEHLGHPSEETSSEPVRPCSSPGFVTCSSSCPGL